MAMMGVVALSPSCGLPLAAPQAIILARKVARVSIFL